MKILQHKKIFQIYSSYLHKYFLSSTNNYYGNLEEESSDRKWSSY